QDDNIDVRGPFDAFKNLFQLRFCLKVERIELLRPVDCYVADAISGFDNKGLKFHKSLFADYSRLKAPNRIPRDAPRFFRSENALY
ncbi:MAG: hypothetical protein HW374_263, partial [Bacteroidetes bacterium]|nr:hypothetical protein [Bacteroidota bacterium]